MKLTVSTRDGPVAHGEEVDEPGAADVHSAIARLDGAGCSEASLTNDMPFSYITAAGGPHLYLVTGETAGGKILQLTDPGADSAPVSLVCGGQRSTFARHDLVGPQAAAAVLIRFLDAGDYDHSFPGASPERGRGIGRSSGPLRPRRAARPRVGTRRSRRALLSERTRTHTRGAPTSASGITRALAAVRGTLRSR